MNKEDWIEKALPELSESGCFLFFGHTMMGFIGFLILVASKNGFFGPPGILWGSIYLLLIYLGTESYRKTGWF